MGWSWKLLLNSNKSINTLKTGNRVYQENYDVFAGLLDRIVPDFIWRVERWGSGTRLG